MLIHPAECRSRQNSVDRLMPRRKAVWKSTVTGCRLLLLALGLLITTTSVGFAPQFGRPQLPQGQQSPSEGRPQQPQPNTPPDNNLPPGLSGKQKQELLKSNFEKMKKDSDSLVDLAKSLQKDLDGSNENVLSLKVVDKADKIEKLAKKIKNAARGY
jgi:hypothetical protein